MSGALKSGLIFGLVGLVGVFACSFVPIVGPYLCGPLAAAVSGGAAGYYGARWSGSNAGVRHGTLAGGIAGIGALISVVALWVVIMLIIRADPQTFQQVLETYLSEFMSQSDVTVDSQELVEMITVIGPIAGFCFGVLNLLIALAMGALGGWMATRNRPAPARSSSEPPPLAPVE